LLVLSYLLSGPDWSRAPYLALEFWSPDLRCKYKQRVLPQPDPTLESELTLEPRRSYSFPSTSLAIYLVDTIGGIQASCIYYVNYFHDLYCATAGIPSIRTIDLLPTAEETNKG
jgi:hypothetical protein